MSDGLMNVGNIVAVSSCKGGVGKSTVAANLACELASRGLKVGLADIDIHGPSIPMLFNLNNIKIQVNDKKQFIPIEKNNVKIMSFGFLLNDAPAIFRGPIVARYVEQILKHTQWGELDYLLIDMPPGTGDVQLTVTQQLKLTGAVIVTTPQTLSLLDVSRGILMFEKVSVPILGIIENMSYFLCDDCHKKHFIFGADKSDVLKESFGVEILAQLPLQANFQSNLERYSCDDDIKIAANNILASIEQVKKKQKILSHVKFDEKNITLRWDDGEEVVVSHRNLRLSCQCALCSNELTGERIFKEEHLKEAIAPKEITPLGNYAIGVSWNDGHASGIYPFERIKKIAQAETAA